MSKITAQMKAKLQRDAQIPHPPTDLTYEARMAVAGQAAAHGMMFHDWQDKPHRVVYDLCREIERLSAPEADAGWQVISDETPKDRDIYLCRTGDSWQIACMGRWIEAEGDEIDQPGHDAGFVDVEYLYFFPGRTWGPEKHRYEGTQPTHWRPLPDLPPLSPAS